MRNSSLYMTILMVLIVANLFGFVGCSVFPSSGSGAAAALFQEAMPTPTLAPILTIVKEVEATLVNDLDGHGVIDPGDTIEYVVTYENVGDGQATRVAIVEDYDQTLIVSIANNYPDGGTYPEYSRELYLELLGPPNDILKDLHGSKAFNSKHLSIIARLTYGKFSMVFAGDAQMENWAHYDREGMLEEKCKVLKAAHHGSRRGSQWERLERLSPKLVIVSSNPESGHNLPDLIGSATFLEYDDTKYRRKVALTAGTGTIKIVVDKPHTGRFKAVCYGDKPTDGTIPGPERRLPRTNWSAIVKSKIEE